MSENDRFDEESDAPAWVATTAGRVTLIVLALVLALGVAAGGWWFLNGGLGGGEPADQAAVDTVRSTGNPEVIVEEGREVYEFTDTSDAQVGIDIAYPDAAIAGVRSEFSQAFADAAAAQLDLVAGQAAEVESRSIPDCGESCIIESTMEIENQGIVDGNATVATRTSLDLGEGAIPGVFAATINLETGEPVALTDLLDIESSAVVDRAVEALDRQSSWKDCDIDPVDYLQASTAFSPTETGVMLLWTGKNPDCGVTSIVVPRSDAGDDNISVNASEEAINLMNSGAANGVWCPADSDDRTRCIAIRQLTVYYQGTGQTWDIRADAAADGCVAMSAVDFDGGQDNEPGAFGTFCRAGTPSAVPEGYSGELYTDQDRIFDSNSGTMYTLYQRNP